MIVDGQATNSSSHACGFFFCGMFLVCGLCNDWIAFSAYVYDNSEEEAAHLTKNLQSSFLLAGMHRSQAKTTQLPTLYDTA